MIEMKSRFNNENIDIAEDKLMEAIALASSSIVDANQIYLDIFNKIDINKIEIKTIGQRRK